MPDFSAANHHSEAVIQQTIRDLLAEANGLVILAKSYGRGLEPTGVISAQQQVLRFLASGAETVPELARQRSTSRQNIQIVVNRLAEMKLVEAVENPRHRRSKLINLTPAGRAALERINNTSRGASLPFDHAKLEPETIEQAVKTLRAVREVWLSGSCAPKPGLNDNVLSAADPVGELEKTEMLTRDAEPMEELPVNLL